MMAGVNYGFELLAFPKTEADFLDVFQRSCLRIVLGIHLTDRIFKSKLCEKRGSIPLSRAMKRERLRWLGHLI